MVKLTVDALNAKLSSKAIDRPYIVLYGPDAGLVSELFAKLKQQLLGDSGDDALNYSSLTAESLKEDPARFIDALASVSLLGGAQLLKVSGLKTALPKAIESYLSKTASPNHAVFIAGELAPSAAIRKFFEKCENAYIIPCYKLDSRQLQQKIGQIVHDHGFSIEGNAIQYLVNEISDDWQVIQSELQKLMLYVGSPRLITLADVEHCLASQIEASMEQFTQNIANRQISAMPKALDRLFAEGVQHISIIRSLNYYFLRLYQARIHLDQGRSEDQSMAVLRPPVFFKVAPNFKRQLRQWSTLQIAKILSDLTQLEHRIKMENLTRDFVETQLLWLVAKKA